jgi:SIR2-like domain
MRFAANGPSIPDELLNARDEGRVVFFCGAGVSRARAGLPDFFGLAEAVIQELGVPEDSTVRKLLKRAREIGNEVNVPGLISADRVFGLLEREFAVRDIQSAVAKSLTPKPEVDVSAHQILLRLATTPASKTQLVTTNFDRLFEKCDPKFAIHQPPRLPNPSRYNDLNGLVYLHGRVNEEYTDADGGGFVLTSSEFGYAYLSEGWAADFFRDIVRTYVVVFVGYSADDPPIHYLLEGLQRIPHPSRRIFAFQPDESDETVARWRDKGVQAIPYGHADKHRALWDTLELWAKRADDPIGWRQSVLALAMEGPEKMQPHVRGQVAHIVSTSEGAREFVEVGPPAEWLCVFDPSCRYSRVERSGQLEPEDSTVDPFGLYGLDSDATPQGNDPELPSAARDVPPGAWNAFISNSSDRVNLSDEHYAAVRGYNATHVPWLPARLAWLGQWIANVANQPAAVWWAVRQQPLHTGLQEGIARSLKRHHDQTEPVIRVAWRYLLEVWNSNDDVESRWYGLKREIERDGWGPAMARALGDLTYPRLSASPVLMSSPLPPKRDASLRLEDLVRLEVECPTIPRDAEIPDEWLEHVLRDFRKNIELAARLCDEVHDMHRFHISPLLGDESAGITGDPTSGLSACVLQFASFFERLVGVDLAKAKREFLAWPADDDTAFCRLRFWAAGKPNLATPAQFCKILSGMSDAAFWSDNHQRDLLHALSRRWASLPQGPRGQIEKRLLEGPPKWKGETDAQYQQYRAWDTLERMQWLVRHGCSFSCDVQAEIAKRRELAPSWKPEYAEHAADSRQTRAGWVATNTEHSALLLEPVDSILSRATELTGRAESNFFEERDPFGGLCAERPVRAYRALLHAARQNQFPQWAWDKFLTSPARQEDSPRLRAAIAARLCRVPDAPLSKLLYPSSSWLQKIAKGLSRDYPNEFDSLTARLIDAATFEPSEARSAILNVRRARDWATAALNSPVGHIAIAILEDHRLENVAPPVDPSERWLAKLERLLNLTGDPRRHAIAITTHNVGWLHNVVSEWTDRHLVSVIDADNIDDREAFWAGFFWNPRVGSPDLYLRLKPALLALAKEKNPSFETYGQSLAYLISLGWAVIATSDGSRAVSDEELRDVLLKAGDEFRSHVLWQIERTLDTKDTAEFERWIARGQEFFRQVWPRQQAVKSPKMSTGLVRLLLSNVDAFSKLVDDIVPLLTKVDQSDHLYFGPRINEIIATHSEAFLGIMHAILPDDPSKWPYGAGELLDKIGESNPKLLADARLQELKRKWNSR